MQVDEVKYILVDIVPGSKSEDKNVIDSTIPVLDSAKTSSRRETDSHLGFELGQQLRLQFQIH